MNDQLRGKTNETAEIYLRYQGNIPYSLDFIKATVSKLTQVKMGRIEA